MIRMCSWCGGYPAMRSIGADECELCYYLPGHEGDEKLKQMANDPEIQQDMTNNDYPLHYQRLTHEAYVMIKPSELARLQAENERLRAFVEALALKAPIKYLAVEHVWHNHYAHIVNEAAALLASVQATAEDTP